MKISLSKNLFEKKYENKEICWILAQQKRDGGWGFFHSLSAPTKDLPLRTEQAIRRLWVLGLTIEDKPIKRTLKLLKKYLCGKKSPPDGREKAVNWNFFEKLMYATWIKIFEPSNDNAKKIAEFWAEIVTLAFEKGYFDEQVYEAEYRKRIPKLISREKIIMPNWFYLVHILKGVLEPQTEVLYIEYLLNNDYGIYYVYNKKIAAETEKSDARYLAALEQLKGYSVLNEVFLQKYRK